MFITIAYSGTPYFTEILQKINANTKNSTKYKMVLNIKKFIQKYILIKLKLVVINIKIMY